MGKAGEVKRGESVGRSSEKDGASKRERADPWSDWQQVAGVPALSAEVLAETLDGGQAFRWNRESDGSWLGLWSNQIVRLRLGSGSRLQWSAPQPLVASTPAALARYLAIDHDFAALSDSLPWRSDPHLARCLAAFPGLRLLRQPFGETLLGFLCSATKQIVQIKQMLALLAERHGAVIGSDPGSAIIPPPTASRAALSSHQENLTQLQTLNPKLETAARRSLPTWSELAQIPEADLRACLLGFRARYISETARHLAAHPGWLEETENAPYATAKARLCELPGVGEKVADCVLLFGAGRFEAFPVDVWILKTLARRYGLDGWRVPHLAQFGRVHFGPLAGLAQQYLFAWERAQKKLARAEG